MAEEHLEDVVKQSQSAGDLSPSDVPATTTQISNVEGDVVEKSAQEPDGTDTNLYQDAEPSPSAEHAESLPNGIVRGLSP